MNPCQNAEKQDSTDIYSGSEPLDQALADRFSMFIDSNPWEQLGEKDKAMVANPIGEGAVNPVNVSLIKKIEEWKRSFPEILRENLKLITAYSISASNALNGAGISFSPRRTRQLSRNLAAVITISGGIKENLFFLTLKSSLPHKCWGFYPPENKIRASHHIAWESAVTGTAPWIVSFLTATSISQKLRIFLENCKSPDEGTEAVSGMLSKSSPLTGLAFAFAVYPAASAGKLKIGSEGVDNLGKLAMGMLEVKKEISFDNIIFPGKIPDLSEISSYCAEITEKSRQERARQFLYACLAKKFSIAGAIRLEKEIEECIQILKERRII